LVCLKTFSRAWCKTIVTPYITWGSYNSFAPSPRFVVCFQLELEKVKKRRLEREKEREERENERVGDYIVVHKICLNYVLALLATELVLSIGTDLLRRIKNKWKWNFKCHIKFWYLGKLQPTKMLILVVILAHQTATHVWK